MRPVHARKRVTSVGCCGKKTEKETGVATCERTFGSVLKLAEHTGRTWVAYELVILFLGLSSRACKRAIRVSAMIHSPHLVELGGGVSQVALYGRSAVLNQN